MLILIQICLVLHIIGLTMMAGATLIDAILHKQFWKQYVRDKQSALGTLEAISKCTFLLPVGFIILLVSGVVMMALTNGIFAEQLWFKIKMLLIVLALINGLAVGRRNGAKLRKLVVEENGNSMSAGLFSLKKRLSNYHTTELLMFLLIFILAVFKFN